MGNSPSGLLRGRMFCTTPSMACALHEVSYLYVQKWLVGVAEIAEKFPLVSLKLQNNNYQSGSVDFSLCEE